MPDELAIHPQVTIGWALTTLAAAALTAFSLYALFSRSLRKDGFRSPGSNLMTFLIFSIMFGSYTVIALVLMFGREALILNQTGFTKRELWSRTHRWEMVSDFRAVPRDSAEKWLVGWFYVPTVIEFRDRSETPATSSIKLSRLWGHSSDDLARTLNEWRARSLEQAAKG